MNSTSFYELAGLVLSLAQMLLYISGFNKYKGRLESLSDELAARAERRFTMYQTLRDRNPEFYEYYQNLPGYNQCDSDVVRAKGKPMADFARNLRPALRATRGFNQMQRVTLVGAGSQAPLFTSAVARTHNVIAERNRVDAHTLERWQAIVSAPTNITNHSDMSTIVNSTFRSMKTFGQGFNSAGIAFGTSLYGVLN